jgi:Fe-S cluster biosynthesis and repair protein YggX
MYRNMLRAKYLIEGFLNYKEAKGIKICDGISHQEWSTLAEFEGILKQVHVLAMESQKDDATAICVAWLECLVAKSKFQNSVHGFHVINLKEFWKRNVSFKKIKTKLILEQELSEIAKMLLSRLNKEFDNYLPQPDYDTLMNIFLNQIVCRNRLL